MWPCHSPIERRYLIAFLWICPVPGDHLWPIEHGGGDTAWLLGLGCQKPDVLEHSLSSIPFRVLPFGSQLWCQEKPKSQGEFHACALGDSSRWAQLESSQSRFQTHDWRSIQMIPASSHLNNSQWFESCQPRSHSDGQRQAIPSVPCVNFGSKKYMHIIKWLLFWATKFGMVCYPVLDNWNPCLSFGSLPRMWASGSCDLVLIAMYP